MDREVRIVDDVAETAVGVFLAAGPRTVVLSGGSTPRAFYERLATVDYPWAEVEFFFGDERCVPPDDDRSNYRMANEALLSRIPAGRTHPIDGAACDADGYERALRGRFVDAIAFDLAIYGLGPDGHTASLFPGRPEVDETERWVLPVPEAGMEPYVPRVTLTVPALSGAELGVFLVEGEEKRHALARLLDREDVPAARLAPERLLILSDRAASLG